MLPQKTTEKERYLKAAKKVEKMKDFYRHLTVYCCVIPFLIFINLRLTPQFHWFWFSLIGWGIGLASHAFQAFDGYKFFLGKDWEEEKIREFMKKEHNNGK